MSLNLSRLKRGDGDSPVRGATLFVIGAVMFILLALGGLAVDLSSKANRGQELQNAVDAAALAAVNEYNTSLDQVKARKLVTDILAQNGEGLTAQVLFTSATEVSVTVTDPNFTGLFAGATGDNSGVSRTATASQDVCILGCNQIVEVPPIAYPISAPGQGDGFLPIEVDDRYYSVNHHDRLISCIDQTTNLQCADVVDVPAFSGGNISPARGDSLITQGMHHPVLIGTNIYYVGYETGIPWGYWDSPTSTWYPADYAYDNEGVITCFDTVARSQCLVEKPIPAQGPGIMANVGDKLYVFTTSHKVFCYETPSLSDCSGYPAAGLDAPFASKSGWELDKTAIWNHDQRIHGDKIYTTMSRQRRVNRWTSVGEVWLQCWDVSSNAECAQFSPKKMRANESQWWLFGHVQGRLSFYRDTNGDPTSVCAMHRTEGVTCRDLDTGQRAWGDETKFDSLRAAMVGGAYPWTAEWSGLNSYHEPTNRLFAVDAEKSVTYCFDFDPDVGDPNFCGENRTTVNGSITQTYGYIEESPNCLIGLGDQSIFHTLKPDMSGPCDSSGGTAVITPCGCTGAANTVWPDLEAVNADGVTNFRVRVTDVAGTPVAPDDTDPDIWHDLLTGPLTLNKLVHADPSLIVIFDVAVDVTLDPTLLTPPTFVIRGQTIAPHLID